MNFFEEKLGFQILESFERENFISFAKKLKENEVKMARSISFFSSFMKKELPLFGFSEKEISLYVGNTTRNMTVAFHKIQRTREYSPQIVLLVFGANMYNILNKGEENETVR